VRPITYNREVTSTKHDTNNITRGTFSPLPYTSSGQEGPSYIKKEKKRKEMQDKKPKYDSLIRVGVTKASTHYRHA